MKRIGLLVFVAATVVLAGCGMEPRVEGAIGGAEQAIVRVPGGGSHDGIGSAVCTALEQAYANAGSDEAKGAIFTQLATKDCLRTPSLAGNDCRALGACWKCDGNGTTTPLCSCVLCLGSDSL